MFADGRRTASESYHLEIFSYHNRADLAQSRQPARPLLELKYVLHTHLNVYSEVHLQETEGTNLNISSLLLHHFFFFHQKCLLHICVCLCRSSSSSVVAFPMPLFKPELKFFVFTCATSPLFTVRSLLSVKKLPCYC